MAKDTNTNKAVNPEDDYSLWKDDTVLLREMEKAVEAEVYGFVIDNEEDLPDDDPIYQLDPEDYSEMEEVLGQEFLDALDKKIEAASAEVDSTEE